MFSIAYFTKLDNCTAFCLTGSAAMAYRPGRAGALAWLFVDNLQESAMSIPPGIQPDRIDVNDAAACEQWAKKLDTTKMQLHDAVVAVGDKAADVEMYLKGSRSTTNDDRIDELGASS